jgi:ATP-dependent helicase/DNAse subunit B
LEAASWPELMEILAAQPECEGSWMRARQAAPERFTAFDAATDLLRHRTRRQHISQGSAFDGDLTTLADEFARLHDSARAWSASRLESYRTCPFGFLIGSVLRLERRQDITEGLDDLQLGNIYHRIFARLYCSVTAWDSQSLLAALPSVAAEILDDAPRREGFRTTAWWGQTRLEIEANVSRSLAALADCSDGFTPFAFEQPFFGGRSLTVGDGPDSFRLHGVIDRVDRSASGEIRIIDYKSGGAGTYDKPAILKGKKLQVPLYALAARDALHLGKPVDGFYWHVKQAEQSGFTLAGFDGGPEGAMQVAVLKAWEAVRGARAGQYSPAPPADGCPGYCSGADVCWHFRPGFGG